MLYLESIEPGHRYLAVFLLGIADSEVAAVAGAFSARAGHIGLPWVMAVMAFSGLCGDAMGFLLGRIAGRECVSWRPSWAERIKRADKVFEGCRTPVILGLRFFWGIRAPMAVAIGLSSTSMVRFLLLDAIGSAVWATVAVGGTYLLGEAFGAGVTGIVAIAWVSEIVLVMLLARSLLARRWRSVQVRTPEGQSQLGSARP